MSSWPARCSGVIASLTDETHSDGPWACVLVLDSAALELGAELLDGVSAAGVEPVQAASARTAPSGRERRGEVTASTVRERGGRPTDRGSPRVAAADLVAVLVQVRWQGRPSGAAA